MPNSVKSWTALRSELISLESQTETLFLEFVSDSTCFDTLEFKKRAEDLFHKRDAAITALSSLFNPDYGGDTIKQYHVQRHKEILEKHQREFEHMNKKRHLHEFEHVNHHTKNQSATQNSETDYFLQESNVIDHSHNMTDQIISQAYAIREDFHQQNYMLNNMNQRISQTISYIPGINLIISKINTRRKKNNLILSFIISICIIMTYFMM